MKETVEEFVEETWLPALAASRKLKPNTVAHYTTMMRAYVLPRIGYVKLRALSADQLRDLYGSLLVSGRRKGNSRLLSPTTVHACHVALRRMLKDAVRWGHLERNVADAASEDAPSPNRREMTERVWSPAQLQAFLASTRDHRLSALWVLFATTGIRRGEAAGLRWSDIDLNAARLTVCRSRVVVNHAVVEGTPKTVRSMRTIALDAATVRALMAHKERQSTERLERGSEYHLSDLVFVWESGSPIHPEIVSRTFKRLARKSSLPAMPLHGLRHSYASAALQAGIALKVVSDRLGHSSINVTANVYSHVSREVDQAAADQVAALILGTET